jgi:hypothetical protein
MSNEQAAFEIVSQAPTDRALLEQQVAVLTHIWVGDVLLPIFRTETKSVEQLGLNDEGFLYPTGKFLDVEVRVSEWDQSLFPSDEAIQQAYDAGKKLLLENPSMTSEVLQQALRAKFPLSGD